MASSPAAAYDYGDGDGDGDVDVDDDDVDDYTDGGGSGILGESWPGHQQGGWAAARGHWPR